MQPTQKLQVGSFAVNPIIQQFIKNIGKYSLILKAQDFEHIQNCITSDAKVNINDANRGLIEELLEMAIKGLRHEGARKKCSKECDEILDKLKSGWAANPGNLWRLCIEIYTRQSYVYNSLKATFQSPEKHPDSNMLPFACLIMFLGIKLLNSPEAVTYFRGTVYRGIPYEFKNCSECDIFMSTSKERHVAESFSNSESGRKGTLIVISNAIGWDIEAFSDSFEEREVLIPPGFKFIEKSRDAARDPIIVYLEMVE